MSVSEIVRVCRHTQRRKVEMVLMILTSQKTGKSNLNSSLLFQPEDMADFELKGVCEAWRFDHKVAVRNPGRIQLPYGGMPLLSLRGLTDMMSVEYAGHPHRGYTAINTCLRTYGVWPALGPLPRAMLPDDMPPQVQRRIDEVAVRSQRLAQEKVRATQATSEIMAQGRQHAIDLVSDSYHVRRYY
jgi:hypothetical protein